jgi:phosphate transport system substrate-binding protein
MAADHGRDRTGRKSRWNQAGRSVLHGKTLAAIFLGKIPKWNHPAIVKLNPKVALPDAAIAVVHRSDGSGTTYNFTTYLSKASDDWKTSVGESTALDWPVGLGSKGNEGVAAGVAQTTGSIGYVEYAYAVQNKMTYADMVNHGAKTVAPTPEAFQAAAASTGTPLDAISDKSDHFFRNT